MERVPSQWRRVVFVTPYYEPVIGGITTFVSGLSRELRNRGADVHILARDATPGEFVEQGPPAPMAFVQWCRSRIRALNPRVVHSHAHWYCLASALSWRGSRLSPRLIFTLHTIPEIESRMRSYGFRRLLRKVDAITFVSMDAEQRFEARFGRPAPTQVTYPGVRQFPGTTLGSPRPLAQGPRPLRISAMSLMSWPGKVAGLRLLLDAMALLARDVPNASLTIVGDGEHRPSLMAHAESLGLSRHVRFLGVVQNPEEILRDSDVFCHISFMDSFAQVILEALSFAVPVVINEGLVEGRAYPRDAPGIVRCAPTPEGVRESLLMLARDPDLRRRLGEAGKARVLREFSWTHQADAFWNLYGFDGGPGPSS